MHTLKAKAAAVLAAAILFFTAAPTAADTAAQSNLLPAVTASQTVTAHNLAADIDFADEEDASRRNRRCAALGHALRGLCGGVLWGAFALLCRAARLGFVLLTFLTGDGILWAFTGGLLLCGLLLWVLICTTLWAMFPEKALRRSVGKRIILPAILGALCCCASAADWAAFADCREIAAALCFGVCALVSTLLCARIRRTAPVARPLWVRRRLSFPLSISLLAAAGSFLFAFGGGDLFLQHIANGAIALPFLILCCTEKIRLKGQAHEKTV